MAYSDLVADLANYFGDTEQKYFQYEDLKKKNTVAEFINILNTWPKYFCNVFRRQLIRPETSVTTETLGVSFGWTFTNLS